MSFKREGNDKSLLDNLRHRRVKDLVAESIPLDEAKLMCNGKFACMVCSCRPVFDTVEMLLVHRKGKKHIANNEQFIKGKKELACLILKRHHEQYMKDGTTNISEAGPVSFGGINPLLPYDPRVKKTKLKPYDRKPRLQVRDGSAGISTSSQSSIWASGPVQHSFQLKNVFKPPQQDVVNPQPYVSKRNIQHSTNDIPTESVSSTAATHRTVSSGVCPASSRIQTVSKTVSDCCITGVGSHLPWAYDVYSPLKTGECEQNSDMFCLTISQLSQRTEDSGSGAISTNCTGSKPSCNSVHANEKKSNKSMSDENYKTAQQYLQIMGSGWKKDWDGKWIRDENAEFDSDEEPPDLP